MLGTTAMGFAKGSTHLTICCFVARIGEFVEVDQSDMACPTPSQKYFCFSEFFTCRLTQITPKSPAIPPHSEGRCATSRTRSGKRWTRMRRWTIGAEADGEVVWS